MDPVGVPLVTDTHVQPSQRQSILGSFLRVRPRGTSQSHQQPPNLHLDSLHDVDPPPSSSAAMPIQQPPSPNPGHRRRPAANGLQPSTSNTSHAFSAWPSGVNTGASVPSGVHNFTHMLRRRRSANGALSPSSANPSVSANASPVDSAPPPPPAVLQVTATSPQAAPQAPGGTSRSHRIRLVPHLDSSRSLHFEPISRDVREGDTPLRIGRFTDRSGLGVAALNAQNTNKLAFKSKVVSRAHAEVWCDIGGTFYIRDTKSSSGTFLNHIRLSTPNTDSKPFPIKDGDVLQLGVDYQGGTEDIYKCVKMRIELGREWQAQANAFNTNAMKQLKALSAQPSSDKATAKNSLAKSGISDCCICLFSVTVHQSLFIAPCSHVFHYKCIRPMLIMHHPGFSCPLCRTFANLEEDVEVEDIDNADDSTGSGDMEHTPSAVSLPTEGVMDVDDAILNVSAALNAQLNTGAETEVEREAAPSMPRRAVESMATLRNGNLPSHPATHIEGVPEDLDEYPMLETEHELGTPRQDVDMPAAPPLPPIPAFTNTDLATIPGASSSSAPSAMQGLTSRRPVSSPGADEVSDGDVFGDAEDPYALVDESSGSSGEGPIGAGGKRKR